MKQVTRMAFAVVAVCALGGAARGGEATEAGGAVDAEVAAFARLEPLAARLDAPFDAREEAAATASLAARAGAADVRTFTATARDRVLLARMLALVDAARWTARALWREGRAPAARGPRAREDDASAALTAACLHDLAARRAALDWYTVRAAGFLERVGGAGAAVLVRRLREPAPPPLRAAIVMHLHGPAAVPVAVLGGR